MGNLPIQWAGRDPVAATRLQRVFEARAGVYLTEVLTKFSCRNRREDQGVGLLCWQQPEQTDTTINIRSVGIYVNQAELRARWCDDLPVAVEADARGVWVRKHPDRVYHARAR